MSTKHIYLCGNITAISCESSNVEIISAGQFAPILGRHLRLYCEVDRSNKDERWLSWLFFSEGEKILDLNKKNKKQIRQVVPGYGWEPKHKWVIHAQTGYFPYTPASVQSSQTGCCSLISGSPERFSPPLWLLLRKRVSFFPATCFPNVTNRWANVTPEPKPKPGLGRGGLSDVDWWANKWLMNTADGVRGDGRSHRPSAPHNPTTPFTE